VDDVNSVSDNATVPGGSSIAVFVSNTLAAVFDHVALQAGKGMQGADGDATMVPFPYQDPPQTGAKGTTDHGGVLPPVQCQPGFTTTGGNGGEPTAPNMDGQKGLPDLGKGVGGTAAVCAASNTGGGNGAVGPNGTDAQRIIVRGALMSTGWTGQSGENGLTGSPGQGGGGGGGASNGGGGSGGAGGCGGAGGTGGQAGGSSIALVSFQSGVNVTNSRLLATDAGPAGKGATGQTGQSKGGTGGDRAGSGCTGGNGGVGGNGGAGGGGAGGISVDVLSLGIAPQLDSATSDRLGAGTLGNLGTAGAGGVAGNGGIGGVSQKEFSLNP